MDDSELKLVNQRMSNIRNLFDVKLGSFEKLIEQKFRAMNDALGLAYKNMEQRLDKLNELRNEVIQDRARYVTNDMYGAQTESLNVRVANLELWQSKVYGIAIGLGIGGGIIGGLLGKMVGL